MAVVQINHLEIPLEEVKKKRLFHFFIVVIFVVGRIFTIITATLEFQDLDVAFFSTYHIFVQIFEDF